jgi:hypothetical protein
LLVIRESFDKYNPEYLYLNGMYGSFQRRSKIGGFDLVQEGGPTTTAPSHPPSSIATAVLRY